MPGPVFFADLHSNTFSLLTHPKFPPTLLYNGRTQAPLQQNHYNFTKPHTKYRKRTHFADSDTEQAPTKDSTQKTTAAPSVAAVVALTDCIPGVCQAPE